MNRKRLLELGAVLSLVATLALLAGGYWYWRNLGPRLALACARGDREEALGILAAGVDPNSRGMDGRTALLTAAQNGDLTLVEALLAHHADPDLVSLNGTRPLIAAAAHADLAMTRRLLDAGAAPDARDSNRLSPLTVVCAARSARPGDRLKVARLLLDRGGAANQRDRFGNTPLIRAAGNSDGPLVRLLLQRGAAVDVTDNTGLSPVYAAELASTNSRARLDGLQLFGPKEQRPAALAEHARRMEVVGMLRRAREPARADIRSVSSGRPARSAAKE